MSNWYSSEMNLWWNISNIWGNLTHPFIKTLRWMIKSVQYSKLLWKDKDWDYVYILILLQYKLKRTRKQILKNDMIVKAEEVAAEIKHVEELIQSYLDDNFCDELYTAHEKKWGESKDLSKPFEQGGRTYYTWNPSRKNATTPELHKQERKEQRDIYDKHERAKQKCWSNIWENISKFMTGWWD